MDKPSFIISENSPKEDIRIKHFHWKHRSSLLSIEIRQFCYPISRDLLKFNFSDKKLWAEPTEMSRLLTIDSVVNRRSPSIKSQTVSIFSHKLMLTVCWSVPYIRLCLILLWNESTIWKLLFRQIILKFFDSTNNVLLLPVKFYHKFDVSFASVLIGFLLF